MSRKRQEKWEEKKIVAWIEKKNEKTIYRVKNETKEVGLS